MGGLSSLYPYFPLDVLDVGNRQTPSRWIVAEGEEDQPLGGRWLLVEYASRRLVCSCPDGQERQLELDIPECPHLRAVIAFRQQERISSGVRAPIDAGSFCD